MNKKCHGDKHSQAIRKHSSYEYVPEHPFFSRCLPLFELLLLHDESPDCRLTLELSGARYARPLE